MTMITSLLSGFRRLIGTAKTSCGPIPSFLVLYVPITFKPDMSKCTLTCNWDILYIVDIDYVRDPIRRPKVS